MPLTSKCPAQSPHNVIAKGVSPEAIPTKVGDGFAPLAMTYSACVL